MKKIGVFGGTFNPIHIGHLAIARSAQEKFNLEKVIFVPCHYPPHKRVSRLVSAQDRFNMVRLGIKDNPCFDISDFEIKKEGKSYSIDTVKYFRGKFSDKTKLFFIIGEDTFSDISSWKAIDEILKIVSFIVVNRPGYAACMPKVKHHSIISPGIDISGSYLRRHIREGKNVKYLVPEDVLKYINHHKLYK